MNQSEWMKTILMRSKCVACEKIQTKSTVSGAGMAEPLKQKPAALGVAALLVVRCSECGYCQVLFAYAPDRTMFLTILNDIASSAWLKHKDSQSQAQPGEPCAIDQLSMGIPVCGPDDSPDTPDTPGVPRPSIRPCTPKTPITEAEMKKFIRRLHRIPLRRTSKGFRQWLRRMTE